MRIFWLASCTLITISFKGLALDVKQRFDHLDKDKNGFLSMQELSSQPHLQKRIAQWDTDKDQQISLLEFKHYLTNKS
ncbi:EF-hand domain-containing protein [Pseudoalteromonas shioyasakiensis]|uniref:EF-hand domain-containing protein n=1 Tax=Pseudoalteromonas shioyasakiensis TaxID=1190813 RepID=UPI002551F302|nr:EF-hand domain-containing protein [Pseudoalteromonas shioyasakiensis]MDK9682097.1 EF-hand domain-containing protein [Pseudoalteromonas shioyasakiensis]